MTVLLVSPRFLLGKSFLPNDSVQKEIVIRYEITQREAKCFVSSRSQRYENKMMNAKCSGSALICDQRRIRYKKSLSPLSSIDKEIRKLIFLFQKRSTNVAVLDNCADVLRRIETVTTTLCTLVF